MFKQLDKDNRKKAKIILAEYYEDILKVNLDRESKFDPKKVLLEGEELTEQFKELISLWFKFLSNEELKITRADFRKMIRYAVHEKSVNDNDKRIVEVFSKYDNGKKGYLILQEFSQFYQVSAKKIPKEVLQNITNFYNYKSFLSVLG